VVIGSPKGCQFNSGLAKVAVLWLNQALCFSQSFCLVDSEVLRNRHLRVAAKRYRIFENDTNEIISKSCMAQRQKFFAQQD